MKLKYGLTYFVVGIMLYGLLLEMVFFFGNHTNGLLHDLLMRTRIQVAIASGMTGLGSWYLTPLVIKAGQVLRRWIS